MAGTMDGKAAIVTGGSKGIGYAIAEALVRDGANVAISARHEDEVRAAAERLSAGGPGRAIGVAADVRRSEEVDRLVSAAAEAFGGLDLLVNNAGVGRFDRVDELSPEHWHQVIDTNLTGVFYCTRACAPHLKARGGGWIINVGSLAGKNPFAGGAAYNASKFGLLGFSESTMLDLRDDDIRVSCIMPGSVNTHFNGTEPSPEGAWKIQSEDVARLVMDLLAMPPNALPSRIEIRPAKVPKR
jgi:3-oxoacyl-[acyl-carrier protein] reductase